MSHLFPQDVRQPSSLSGKKNQNHAFYHFPAITSKIFDLMQEFVYYEIDLEFSDLGRAWGGEPFQLYLLKRSRWKY